MKIEQPALDFTKDCGIIQQKLIKSFQYQYRKRLWVKV